MQISRLKKELADQNRLLHEQIQEKENEIKKLKQGK
jgi:hypothetical protein